MLAYISVESILTFESSSLSQTLDKYAPLMQCYLAGVTQDIPLKDYVEATKDVLMEKYPEILNLANVEPKKLQEFITKVDKYEFMDECFDEILKNAAALTEKTYEFKHRENAPAMDAGENQVQNNIQNNAPQQNAPQQNAPAPREPEIDPAVKKLQDDQKEIERKGESGKYNLESMGKGVYINGKLYEAKVRCAIDYIVAKEVELRGGLKQGESAVSIEKELFPTKNERARLLELLDSTDGEEFTKLVSDGKFIEALHPQKAEKEQAKEDAREQANEHGNEEVKEQGGQGKELKAPGV